MKLYIRMLSLMRLPIIEDTSKTGKPYTLGFENQG